MSAHPLTVQDNADGNAAMMWMLGAAVVALAVDLFGGARIGEALGLFPWEILAIYVALEVFTNMLVATDALGALAVKAGRLSGAKPSRVPGLAAVVLFAVGTANNNLTSVLVVLPAVLVLLKTVAPTAAFVRRFFGLFLAISNCAGASTPIGDFPALLIIGTGVISFRSYLFLAFPLFVLTACILVGIYWLLERRRGEPAPDKEEAALALRLLDAGWRHRSVDYRALRRLGIVFALMLSGWIFLPSSDYPISTVAWFGVSAATLWLWRTGVRPAVRSFDLDPVLRITAALFVAAVAESTGAINDLAGWLAANIGTPKLLLLAVMVATTILCGLFEAGATAAAMLPLVQTLTATGGPLHSFRDVAVVAFAASICAGSSLLLTSATAGQLLGSKVSSAGLLDQRGASIRWGFRSYLPYGVLNCTVQLAVAIAWAMLALAIGGTS